jgi:hypothetical protein
MRPTICSLFEPHHKQNLYTNPKRTAKPSLYQIRYASSVACSKIIVFQRIFLHSCEEGPGIGRANKNLPSVQHSVKGQSLVSSEKIRQTKYR